MNTDMLAKVFDVAGRVDTPEQEALASVRRIKTLLEKEGMSSFSELFAHLQGQPGAVVLTTGSELQTALKGMTFDERQQLILAQAAKIETLEAQNFKLEAEIFNVTERQTTRVKAGEDGCVSYAAYTAEVWKNLGGTNHRWQSKVKQQLGVTDVDLRKWAASGRVPHDQFIKTKALRPQRADEKPVPVKWTLEVVGKVRALSAKGKTEKEIAEILSNELDREVTQNHVKRLRYDSRNGMGVFKDPAFGGPILIGATEAEAA